MTPAGQNSGAPRGLAEVRVAASAAPRVLVGFVAVFGCLTVLGDIAQGVRSQEVHAVDVVATPFLHQLASPTLDAVMTAATFVGSNVVLVPLAVVTTAALVAAGKPRDAVFVAVAMAGSLALNGAMKVLFERPRPPLPSASVLPDYSFPSGHSMNSLVLFVALAVVVWQSYGRRIGAPAAVAAVTLSLLIGASRVYLGDHYLTDVIGGFTAGLIWLAVVAGTIEAGYYGWGRWRGIPRLSYR